MKLVTELPHVACICRDASRWVIPTASLQSFLDTWMAGKTFWVGETAWGERVWIKLADITGVVEKTEAGLRLDEEEAEERSQRKLTKGEE